MTGLWSITWYGLLSGTIGTACGGLLSCFLPAENMRMNGTILAYSSGLMAAVICFDLLPNAFLYASLPYILLGILIGVAAMVLSDSLLAAQKDIKNAKPSKQVGLSIALGVALHNFPEGLAVGSGFEADPSLGIALALAIMFHDIPEGAAIAIPLRAGGVSRKKAFLYTVASGLPMGLGAFIGAWAGQVSTRMIALCLAIAGGAMLYVVFADMLPEAQRMQKGKAAAFATIAGVVSGFVITSII